MLGNNVLQINLPYFPCTWYRTNKMKTKMIWFVTSKLIWLFDWNHIGQISTKFVTLKPNASCNIRRKKLSTQNWNNPTNNAPAEVFLSLNCDIIIIGFEEFNQHTENEFSTIRLFFRPMWHNLNWYFQEEFKAIETTPFRPKLSIRKMLN